MSYTSMTRRSLLTGVAAAALLPAGRKSARAAVRDFRLTAGPAKAPLSGGSSPETGVWAYNGTVPGPELRVRQGERLKVTVENRLTEGTTVHWHGIRLPNAMDGVPDLTQPLIAPGKAFTYEFDVPDAGTYWYHPHQRSFEQVARGLSGALIVEERTPINVDRDVVWVLSDWRLLSNGQIGGDFGNMHDMAHDGRIGNTVTVNGRAPETFTVRSGERIRLRLINAANARIFGLDFSGHRPLVVAYDGQPVAPHAPENGRVVLGPAMRVDLILDMTGQPGQRFEILDRFYRDGGYRLLDVVYASELLRRNLLDTPIALPANTMPEPDVAKAQRHDITFNGGMMGMMMGGGHGNMGGMNMMEMMRSGKIWFVNGVTHSDHAHHELMFTLRRGRSYVFAMHNETAWWHPMHLHGHSFRVISRNGSPTRHREWQDTVLMAPRESVEIAFVADNPGDWMLHCHVLEHQESGMMGVVRVA